MRVPGLHLLRHRRRLTQARGILRRFEADGDQERLTRQASYIYLGERTTWADALIQAAETIESDRRDAARYAVIAATPTDEDREWAEAAERAAGELWRER